MAKVKFDTNSRVYLSNDGEGTNNTVFGYGAGGSIDTGDNYNVFIGHNVGSTDMNNAVSNTGVGYAALVSLTQGSNNTILGAESGYALTTGANNTFIGMQAGDALTQGDNNIAIGIAAMGALSTTDGSDKNIAIGNWAMDGVSSLAATENVFIGHNSGGGSWTGTLSEKNVAIGNATMAGAMNDSDKNTAIGYEAGKAITEASNNVIIGAEAGDALTTGASNVIIGQAALGAADGAEHNNVVIGKSAGESINHDNADNNILIGKDAGAGGAAAFTQNIAIGVQALDGTGSAALEGCVVIGYQAGTAIDHTDSNGIVAIGHNAGAAAQSCTNTTLVGYAAGDALTTGDDNTAIGRHALGAEDAGSNSTAVGYQALGSQNNDTGYNTAVGWTAGDGIVAGYANTLIGAESGTTGTNDLTSGIQNVLIGQATSVSASGATNQVVIGRGAAGVADNSVTLGNTSVTAVYASQDSGAVVYCSGINFPDDASSNHSGDANTLDNYEEGTFTGTFTATTSAPDLAQTATGYYTKVGNVCFITWYINNSNMTGASGQMRVSGLPFTALSGTENILGGIMSHSLGMDENANQCFQISGGYTAMEAYESDDGAWGDWQVTAASGKYLRISGTYLTA